MGVFFAGVLYSAEYRKYHNNFFSSYFCLIIVSLGGVRIIRIVKMIKYFQHLLKTSKESGSVQRDQILLWTDCVVYFLQVVPSI